MHNVAGFFLFRGVAGLAGPVRMALARSKAALATFSMEALSRARF